MIKKQQDKMLSRTICGIFMILSINLSFGQTYQEKICNFSTTSGPAATGNGNFSFQTAYSNSGSLWEVDWDETHVFQNLIQYNNPSNPNQSFEMRMGKGGQIYSFKNAGFGEALPPQWRPSFDLNGQNISNPGSSNPINSHHGNWAPWNDEVWQLVGSDQRDSLDNEIKSQNIHQAGSYMNNYSHRASDLTVAPFYSPILQSYYDNTNQSFSSVYWGQSENPAYVYDSTTYCDVCFNPSFRPSILYYQQYKNLGDGVIQVDFLIYNYHRQRGIDYWNIPFLGIRNSSLPYVFMSNSPTNELTYDILNSKTGHPVTADTASYLPEFNKGVVRATSGNNAQSSGWFAFSTDAVGSGAALAFVTAKSSANPANAYGDIRYGTAMVNAVRDVSIFSRRAIGGNVDPLTGLRPWGIVAGESIQGRYFIVVDANINNIVQQIQNRNLISEASIEKVQISNISTNDINYDFINNGSGIYSAVENSSAAFITLNSQPFTGSYPVFLISTNTETILSSNPYYYSLKPYDGTVQSTELLGFSTVSVFSNLTNVLPVELLSFEAIVKENNQVLLTWQTASEINNDYFLIQRSPDGKDWENLEKIQGAGNATEVLNYNYTDKNPLAETSYYRLQQIDFDGKSTYSPIKNVTISQFGKTQLVTYPNPTSDNITIKGNVTNLQNLRIYDVFGHDVTAATQQTRPNETELFINLSNLDIGIYFLKTKNKICKIYKQ